MVLVGVMKLCYSHSEQGLKLLTVGKNSEDGTPLTSTPLDFVLNFFLRCPPKGKFKSKILDF